jgi:ABC-type transport system substrate-binding protein
VRGAAAYCGGSAKPLDGLRAPDPRTLVIELKQADLSFGFTACYMLFPIPREELGEAFATRPVGNGPYKLAEWTRGVRLRFERNPYYPDPARQAFDEIDVMIGGDENLHYMMFQRGELDFLWSVPSADGPLIRKDPALAARARQGSDFSTVFLMMNCEMPPLNDPRVRQAVDCAINRERLSRLLGGLFFPARGALPPISPGFDPEMPAPQFDLERAKELLSAAGYSPAASPVEIWMSASPDRVRIGLAIQHDLEKAGFRVTVRTMSLAALVSAIGTRGKVPLFLMGYSFTPDPKDVFELLDGKLLRDQDCQNFCFYNNERFNALLEEADACPDREKRLRLYQQAQRVSTQDVPWAPLCHRTLTFLIQPWLEGVQQPYYFRLPDLHPRANE